MNDIQHSLMISTTLESLFLKGRLRKMKRAMNMEVNMRMGSAYMGLEENIPMMRAYISFRKYLIIMRNTPNLLSLSIPL